MRKKFKFILYSNKLEVIKEYEKVNGEYIKLNNPIKNITTGAWRHSFACTLTNAIKQPACLLQILKFNRFYYSIGNIDQGTKFNILLFPLVYFYSLIDTKQINKVKLVY